MSRPNIAARRRVHALLAPLLVSALGCFSSVRLIRDTPDGGVLVIPNNSNQWPTYYRNRAETLMHKKCPNGYVIDHEEVIEYNSAAQDGRYPWEDFDYNGGYQRLTSSTQKQYRITFRRAAAFSNVSPPMVKPAPPLTPPPAPLEEAPPPRPVPIS